MFLRHLLAGTLLLALCLAAAACGDDGVEPEANQCDLRALPFADAPNGPLILDVGLEVQVGEGIIVVATASDPQGSDNLDDVLQSVGVYPDDGCRGTPLTVVDDLGGSGIEEAFGTAVSVDTDPALVAAITAAVSWPVHVDFVDLDGHTTRGDVSARIIR